MTDAHYEQAATAATSALQNPVQALQNPVQQDAATDRTESHNPQQTREFAGACDDVRHCIYDLVGDEGPETTPFSPQNQGFSPLPGAKSGAVEAQSGAVDERLSRLLTAWPTLDEMTVVAIMALIGRPS